MRHWTVFERRVLRGSGGGWVVVSAAPVGFMTCWTAATQARIEYKRPTHRGGALKGSCQNFSYCVISQDVISKAAGGTPRSGI